MSSERKSIDSKVRTTNWWLKLIKWRARFHSKCSTRIFVAWCIYETELTQACRLKGSESKLESIAQSQGSNVSSLVSLVKENGAIQKQMMVRMDRIQDLLIARLFANTAARPSGYY
jgi:hypothetical protein